MQQIYAISEEQIRRGGGRLKGLALLGQAVATAIATVVVFLAFCWTYLRGGAELFGIAAPPTPWEFLASDDVILYLLYCFAQLAGFYLLLEGVRRLGASLAGNDPLGASTLRCLRLLRWGCIALALLMSVEPTLVSTSEVDVDMDLEQWVPPSLAIGVSLWPLYFSALAMIGISILQRIVGQAVALRMESESFV
jgi:hypothetical protein